eukprot:TRINITY_DN7669_c0_g1_i1.p1 TRINITY_DN7669_c0_g1~~TRINITY_DN7669_c0_g1_i1.p1  ORF type:complete len:411 (+),score=48.74 TRINITY_DN7669_c0_g1_i1:42-1235(+)
MTDFHPLIFVGGSAMLPCIEVLGKVKCPVVVVVPTTDDGGSSGEIVRTIGGPAVGDLRSAVSRLGMAAGAPESLRAFLACRLPVDSQEASAEWKNILENQSHNIYNDLPVPFKMIVQRYLQYFDDRIPTNFNFSNGSLGNFFLTGARLHFGNLDSGLFLLSRLWHLPDTTSVIPSSLTADDDKISLGVVLDTGERIVGQNNISHPTTGNVVNKEAEGYLGGWVERVFFEENGNEVEPLPHPDVLAAISSTECNIIVYGRGSFLTSILPSLVFCDVIAALCEARKPKVFVLNGSHDRETTVRPDMVLSLSDLLRLFLKLLNTPLADYLLLVTHVFLPEDSRIAVGEDFSYTFPRIQLVSIPATVHGEGLRYNDKVLVEELQRVAKGSEKKRERAEKNG